MASLFQLMRNPNGHRRPDLISLPDHYAPRFSMEAKSGRARKGVLVEYQLHYGITGADDFREFFGEHLPTPTDSGSPTLFDLSKPEVLSNSPVAFYYNVVTRTDEIASDDLDRPFSALRLQWGDQHIVPGEYGFYAFAVARHMRTGESMNSILDDLRQTIRENIVNQHSNYQKNKEKQSWQDLHGRDVLAIFHDNDDYTTKEGKQRVQLIGAHYPLADLKRYKMKGPSGTWIYVLAEPEHEDLFNRQIRSVVRARRPVLEKLTRARAQAEGKLLKKIRIIRGDFGLFENGEAAKIPSLKRLNRGELQRLERLVHWLDQGEHVLTEKDYVPF